MNESLYRGKGFVTLYQISLPLGLIFHFQKVAVATRLLKY